MATGWVDVSDDTGLPWVGVPVGPLLAEVVAGIDVAELAGSHRVSFLAACEQVVAWAQAQSARAMASAMFAHTATFGPGVDAYDSRIEDYGIAEIAAALHVSPATAGMRIHTARIMTEVHPQLAQALEDGQVTWSQAVVITDTLSSIRPTPGWESFDIGTEFLASVLPTAGQYPPARLRERCRHLLDRIAPQEAITRRKTAVKSQTGIHLWTGADGLATLGITGHVIDIQALKQRIHAHTHTLTNTDSPVAHPHGELADRTTGQWQVAALLNLVGLTPVGMPAADTDAHTIDGDPVIPGFDIRIVLDLPTALGLADNPGHLPGYGPLDPDLARELAASGDWTRWVTDPITGHLLDDGDRRFPTARLARYIKARDHRCNAPGCNRATNLDIDHIPTYASTRHTSATTLTRTCPGHNRSRDKAGWTTPAPNTWTTALGRTYYATGHQPLPQPDTPPPEEPIPF